MRKEISNVDSQIRATNKQLKQVKEQKAKMEKGRKKITAEIKDLIGPMSRTLRSSVPQLGIELTVYWAGQFVGPQITKLLDQERYKFVLENLQATFVGIVHKLSIDYRDVAEAFWLQMGQFFTAFYMWPSNR